MEQVHTALPSFINWSKDTRLYLAELIGGHTALPNLINWSKDKPCQQTCSISGSSSRFYVRFSVKLNCCKKLSLRHFLEYWTRPIFLCCLSNWYAWKLRIYQFKNILKKLIYRNNNNPDSGRVGRVTDCGVRGLGFKSPGPSLTSRIETRSLSRVVRDGWDPSPEPLSGWKKSLLRWSHRLGSWTATLYRKLHKNKNKTEEVNPIFYTLYWILFFNHILQKLQIWTISDISTE